MRITLTEREMQLWEEILRHLKRDARQPTMPKLPEAWWKAWPADSVWSALGVGALALLLMQIENPTAQIVIGTIAAVFALMITQIPTPRFRRWFQWGLACWMAANALGIAIVAPWKNAQGEAKLQWEVSVGWSFSAGSSLDNAQRTWFSTFGVQLKWSAKFPCVAGSLRDTYYAQRAVRFDMPDLSAE